MVHHSHGYGSPLPWYGSPLPWYGSPLTWYGSPLPWYGSPLPFFNHIAVGSPNYLFIIFISFVAISSWLLCRCLLGPLWSRAWTVPLHCRQWAISNVSMIYTWKVICWTGPRKLSLEQSINKHENIRYSSMVFVQDVQTQSVNLPVWTHSLLTSE